MSRNGQRRRWGRSTNQDLPRSQASALNIGTTSGIATGGAIQCAKNQGSRAQPNAALGIKRATWFRRGFGNTNARLACGPESPSVRRKALTWESEKTAFAFSWELLQPPPPTLFSSLCSFCLLDPRAVIVKVSGNPAHAACSYVPARRRLASCFTQHCAHSPCKRVNIFQRCRGWWKVGIACAWVLGENYLSAIRCDVGDFRQTQKPAQQTKTLTHNHKHKHQQTPKNRQKH